MDNLDRKSKRDSGQVAEKMICDGMSIDASRPEGREENMVQRIAAPDMVPQIVLLCSFCGRLRNDAGKWEKIDRFSEKYPYACLSHGMCPECAEVQFPDEYEAICLEKKREEANKSDLMAGFTR